MKRSLPIPKVRVNPVGSLLLPKIERLWLALIVFLLPTQLGRHFWPDSALVYGIRVDYLAPTIYVLDLLILGYLVAKRSVLKRNSRDAISRRASLQAIRTDLMVSLSPRSELSSSHNSFKILNSKFEIGLLSPLFPILLTNLIFSRNPLATLSWSLHFVFYGVFVFTVFPGSPRSVLKRNSRDAISRGASLQAIRTDLMVSPSPHSLKILNSKFEIMKVLLFLSILFQVTLALVQVIMGHSVGGVMYYLGERMVSVGQPSVALATFMGQTMLRAYGTFGHPNVLAGWLLIATLIILKLTNQKRSVLKRNSRLQVEQDSRCTSSVIAPEKCLQMRSNLGDQGRTDLMVSLSPRSELSSSHNSFKILNSKFEIGLLTLATLGILLTQSRAVLFAFFGILIPLNLLKSLKFRLLYFVIFLITAYCTLIANPPPRTGLSISERLSLQKVSVLAIGHWPLFGTGANASISVYPSLDPVMRLLQPDHNSLTLLVSWFGLFGVLAIIYYLKNCLKFDYWNLIIIMPLLLLDHYLFTSPQGLLILLLYIRATIYPCHH